MSDLTALLLNLLTEIVNKHDYAFMHQKNGLYYIQDDYSPTSITTYIH